MNDSQAVVEAGLLQLCNSRLRPAVPITTETRLIEQGLLDSLLVMDLVSTIEKQFGVSLDNSAISPRNFRNVRALAAMVTSQLAARDKCAD